MELYAILVVAVLFLLLCGGGLLLQAPVGTPHKYVAGLLAICGVALVPMAYANWFAIPAFGYGVLVLLLAWLKPEHSRKTKAEQG